MKFYKVRAVDIWNTCSSNLILLKNNDKHEGTTKCLDDYGPGVVAGLDPFIPTGGERPLLLPGVQASPPLWLPPPCHCADMYTATAEVHDFNYVQLSRSKQ